VLTQIEKSQKVQVKRTENRMSSTKKELKPGFAIGDIVKLYRYNLATSWSGKIEVRWFEENYVVPEKLKKGSYFIKNISNL
jgi:hypothetical protein